MKYIVRIIVFGAILCLFLAYNFINNQFSGEVESLNQSETIAVPEPVVFSIDHLKYIIHGGGFLKGTDDYGVVRDYLCSSSVEGLNQCASAGATAIELDFNFTSDEHLVCVHHWGKEFNDRFLPDNPPTLEAFLSSRIYDHFTPVSLGEIKVFLENNPDIYIITDIKDRNLEGLSYIAKKIPHLKDRFVVQIYCEEEYQPVRQLGFEKIIYTLYSLTWHEKTDYSAIQEFVKNHSIVAITFDYTLCNYNGYVSSMLGCGVPLLIHTVNDKEEQQKYFDMGISGIYTDVVKASQG